jgi:outer membrane lipoprotein-sorting protein
MLEVNTAENINKKIMRKIFFLIVLIFFAASGQGQNPDEVLNKVKENFARINDYSVNISVKVDVSFLKVPQTNATIYFKKPDKIKLYSKDFALLPKEGLDFSPMSLLKKKYTAIFDKDTLLNNRKVSVIKVIPLNDESNVVLTTLWIDQEKNVILRAESATKINGTFLMEFNYDNSPDDFPLPSSMIFSFNSSGISVPQFPGDDSQENSNGNENKEERKPETGKVYVNYYNYKVNKGLPDSIFTSNGIPNK